MFDVGPIVRDLQRVYGIAAGTGPLRATAATLAPLILQLRAFTAELVEASTWQLAGNREAWDLEMADWRTRLAEYYAATQAALLQGMTDTETLLWDVTAPLLLGIYGGPDDDSPLRPMDAVTPYRLANMLEVATEAQMLRHAQLLDDIERAYSDAAADVVETVTAGIGVGTVIVGVVAAALALDWWRSRSRGRR